MNQRFLTVSIPAYNDSVSLHKLVTETQVLCSSLNLDFDILIINDGSTDNTLKVAQDLALKYGNIKIINHEKNLGFGTTLKEVFMVPKSEWVLFLPGDNQFPISNLTAFLKLKDDYDYILGIRKDRQDMIHRILYAYIYSWLVSFLSGFKVTDVNSIVFYRSKIFDKIHLKGNSGFVHAEFFIRSSKANFRMVEMEILHQEREFGTGSGAKFGVALKIFKDLFLYLAGKL